MKKPLFLIAILFTVLSSSAQKEKVYTSLEEALKNPSEVYILSLNDKKLNNRS